MIMLHGTQGFPNSYDLFVNLSCLHSEGYGTWSVCLSVCLQYIYIYNYPEENQVASYIQEKEFDLWLRD